MNNQFHYSLSVDLYRDGLNSPWGFRLKGGIDVDGGTPLEIIKVSLKNIRYESRNCIIVNNKLSLTKVGEKF